MGHNQSGESYLALRRICHIYDEHVSTNVEIASVEFDPKNLS